MERLTQWFGSSRFGREAGMAQKYDGVYTEEELINVLLSHLAAYEDTGLDPKEVMDLKDGICSGCSVPQASDELRHIQDLLQAEKDGRLVVVGEEMALAMSAGARAILNNKRLQGVTYVYDFLGEFGGPKEIFYFQAAKVLQSIGNPALMKEAEK